MYPQCCALLFLVTLIHSNPATARAVNINNTWMLPEEGFPVFYRYFRDRISWYEADAVCQFHHANLVTADSTSQYDAIRAYLKELDITENVWIGLSKNSERPNFTWMDFRPLNGDGRWQQAIPKGSDPLCVAMDPTADFLWKPMSCGGSDLASFICELPVPSWAMGSRGCLLTEVPSLTVLYIPEESAIELTSDCGLDGTKRIACKGNIDREEILKQLSCSISNDDFEEHPTKTTLQLSTDQAAAEGDKTTKAWIWTSNTIDIDYGVPTRHRRETEDTVIPTSIKSTTDLSTYTKYNKITTDNPKVSQTFTSKAESETTTENPSFTIGKNQNLSSTIESKSSTEPDVEDTGEFPSAIAQGELFSVMENGTILDIIELNETAPSDLHQDKTTSSVSSTVLTPKKLNMKAAKTEEIVISPVIPDVTLHRTFRKELPEDGLNPPEEETIYKPPPAIHFLPSNKLSNEEINEADLARTLPSSKLYAISKKLRDNESVKAEGLSTTSGNPLGAEPENQPRPNRQRQLTRPQRRTFYPYFFSRVLG